jgi:adenosine deaminase
MRPLAISTFASAVPKVQLHCHLEGTIRPQRFRDLAKRRGVDIGARADGPIEQAYAFADFRAFLLLFADVCKTLARPEDYAQLAGDYAADASRRNVLYAEVFISPSVWTFFHRELDVRASVEAIRAALDAAERDGGPRVALIVDLTRNFGLERALATARIAESLTDLGVIGVGLGGDEKNFPAPLFEDAFSYAAAAGLKRVVHAGEADGAQSVRAAVERLGAQRIGHGVRAIEDPAVVAMLADRGIALEICPTSNRLTGAAPRDRPHPVGLLDAAGVRCVIDADDPALFGASVDGEYAILEREFGRPFVERLAANAIEASFAAGGTKARLRAALAAFLDGGAGGTGAGRPVR